MTPPGFASRGTRFALNARLLPVGLLSPVVLVAEPVAVVAFAREVATISLAPTAPVDVAAVTAVYAASSSVLGRLCTSFAFVGLMAAMSASCLRLDVHVPVVTGAVTVGRRVAG